MIKTLSHPNVLQFMGVLYRDTKMLLITEYLDGGSYASWVLNKDRPFSWPQRVRCMRNIASCMVCFNMMSNIHVDDTIQDYLHSKRIIHRDLTSSNCLLRSDGTVVVVSMLHMSLLLVSYLIVGGLWIGTVSLREPRRHARNAARI